ncbi:glycosyltransferase 87 family protein [Actinoallomurus sp. NBC_01490]|uniref:glycosyltransferase 87 family protein n=1 Tax=Actinoallomurus sp. NBC_01490 TaxID=2903557 RepID=UPI002E33AF66|nr:glycosyltransferase 87 family protein [Actinoallomurus sp. NBC_01490]
MGGRRTIRGVVIVATAIAITAVAVAPLVLHWLTNQPDQRLVDLDVYRSGGQAVLRGGPVYDFLTQPPQLLPFTYPTFAVLLAVPLALVPWTAAQWLWTALIFVAMALVVRYSFARLLGRIRPWAPIAVGVLVALCAYAMPLRDQVRFGQVDIMLVAMCVADVAPGRTRWPRGVLVGLATAIKLVPGVFVIYFLVTGRRREAINAAVAAVAATLLTFLVLPGDSVDYWFRALFDSDRLGSNNGTTNQSIRGMLLRLYWPDAVTSLIWLVCVAIVAYFGFRAARAAWRDGDEIRGIAITGLIAVLVSPVSWIHHLAWLVVVLGAIVGDGRDLRRVVLGAGVWLFYVLEVPWWGITMLAHHIGPRFLGRIVQDAYGLGALLLLVGLWRVRRHAINSQSDGTDTSRNEPRVGTLNS